MADSQVPWGVEALDEQVTEASLAQQAQLVPGHDGGPDDPTAPTTDDGGAGWRDDTEVSGSHAIYVSQPGAVASLITRGGMVPARRVRS